MASLLPMIRGLFGGNQNRAQTPNADQAIEPLSPEVMAQLYPEPDWLQDGAPWPNEDVKKHVEDCEKFAALFKADFHEVYAAQYERLRDLENPWAQNTYEQVIALTHALPMVWRALLTAEPPQFSAGDHGSAESLAVQRLVRDTDLVGSLKKGALDQSVKAEAVFVVGYDPRLGRVTIDPQPPERWYPFLDPANANRKLADVLFYEEKVSENGGAEVRYINAAVHYPGMILHRRFQIKDGKLKKVDAERRPWDPATGALVPENQPTGVPESLVWVAPNISMTGDATSMSDLEAIDTIVAELSVRASQLGKLLDKFADPMAYGPQIDPTENPATGQFEVKVRGKYIHMRQGDPAPGYAVWDPQMTPTLEWWKKLLQVFFMVSGTTEELFQIGEKGRGATSGTALKLMLMRPLQVAADKAQQFDQALGGALYVAQLLEQALGLAPEAYTPTRPTIGWNDGLPADPKEEAEIAQIRTGNQPTMSQYRAIQKLDNLDDKETKLELGRIQDEEATRQPAGGLFMPGADQNLNGPEDGAPDSEDGAA